MHFVYATAIFILAGLCEIGGGYLIWLWLRADKPMWLGFLGGIALILYGIVATLQTFPTFGRVYAAYGGVFIVLSLMWAYWVDKEPPDKFDIIGGIICVIGVLVMVLPSRG